MDPGPLDRSLLVLQDRHISETCAQSLQPFDCVTHAASTRLMHTDDERVRILLLRAGFLSFSRLDYVRLDRALLTALVERWRPETSTFHFRVGEMAITLQDVAVILGLRIDGQPVISQTEADWGELCLQLLGHVPEEEKIRGGSVNISWIRQTFEDVPGPDAPHAEVEWYTRAYILDMISSSLFPDVSRSRVHLRWLLLLQNFDIAGTYSWGSAVLAFLQSEMSAVAVPQGRSRLLGGCLVLLQLWSWNRIGVGIPRFAPQPAVDEFAPFGYRYNVARRWDVGPDRALSFYRDQFDMLEDTSVCWMPYADDILDGLPEICRAGSDIWRSRTHILCYQIVSCHLPDRVLRQFGMSQHIPEPPMVAVYSSMKGKAHYDWFQVHHQYIQMWGLRHDLIVEEVVPPIGLHQYLRWYWDVTRRFIITECQPPTLLYTPRGPIERDLVHTIFQIRDLSLDYRGGVLGADEFGTNVGTIIDDILARHDFRRPDIPIRTYTRRRGASQASTDVGASSHLQVTDIHAPTQSATDIPPDIPLHTQPADVLGDEAGPSQPHKRKKTPCAMRRLRG